MLLQLHIRIRWFVLFYLCALHFDTKYRESERKKQPTHCLHTRTRWKFSIFVVVAPLLFGGVFFFWLPFLEQQTNSHSAFCYCTPFAFQCKSLQYANFFPLSFFFGGKQFDMQFNWKQTTNTIPIAWKTAFELEYIFFFWQIENWCKLIESVKQLQRN